MDRRVSRRVDKADISSAISYLQTLEATSAILTIRVIQNMWDELNYLRDHEYLYKELEK